MPTEDNGKEIREEVYLALTRFEREKQGSKPKNRLEKIFSYLSNGFILLLLGSLITSILVPYYQHKQKVAAQTLELQRETFSQFLLYTNSIWQEYYLMFPLVHESEISKDTYNEYLNKISTIKLKRYNAYAIIRGVGISFRNSNSTERSEIEKQIKKYAVEVNRISKRIDEWLKKLYCRSRNCVNTEVSPEFLSYGVFLQLGEEMQRIHGLGNDVSEAMVLQMNKK